VEWLADCEPEDVQDVALVENGVEVAADKMTELALRLCPARECEDLDCQTPVLNVVTPTENLTASSGIAKQ
jgi:hypothetical protein